VLFFGFSNCCVWIFKIYFQKDFSSTKIIIGLSHNHVPLLRRFVAIPKIIQDILSTMMSTSPVIIMRLTTAL